MKVIYNDIIPPKGFVATNLFGVIFARREFEPLSERTLNHEAIHTSQMKELLYIFFYIIYGLEWVFRVITPPWDSAYEDITFEKEAYANETEQDYLNTRKHYAQWRG